MQVVKLLAGAGELAALIDQLACLRPLLGAHRFEDVIVEGRQRAEFRRGAHQRIAENGEQLHRLITRARGDEIHFQESVAALGRLARVVGDDDGRAVLAGQFARAFGEQRAIAGDRIGRLPLRGEAARDRLPRRDSDSDLDGGEGCPVETAFLRKLFVHRGDGDRHRLRRIAGVDRMLAVVQRRVPIGHETFAAEMADGAAMLQRRIDQRAQRRVDHAREIRRIVPEGFRQFRVAAQADRQACHHARFAVEPEQ